MDYEYFDHTADIGVKAFGESLEEVFINAAKGLVSIVYETAPAKETKVLKVELENPEENSEQLLVDWLNEILFLMETEDAVPTEFKILSLDGRRIEAEVRASPSENHRYKTEVKSVTYHMLEIGRENDKYFGTILFDI